MHVQNTYRFFIFLFSFVHYATAGGFPALSTFCLIIVPVISMLYHSQLLILRPVYLAFHAHFRCTLRSDGPFLLSFSLRYLHFILPLLLYSVIHRVFFALFVLVSIFIKNKAVSFINLHFI